MRTRKVDYSAGVELLRWRCIDRAGTGVSIGLARLSIPAVPELTDDLHPWCLVRMRGSSKPVEVLANYRTYKQALQAFEAHQRAHLGL